jgi:ABC-type dipeptide/oligopeptide/nickel transport system ATPase component
VSVIEHPSRRAPGAGDREPGRPGPVGRWQPTRAGVVNSWAWAEETFLFADGWLALTGPNGSGKSLTASMLVTVLLDADVSQTALSVSGKAAGTLTSRHTDRSERDDKTGIWWLEYGLRDPAGEDRHLTTGLWLRSTGGDLQRAFFITPQRAGTGLTLQRDREPVRIDDLAGQMSAGGGELFTSSAKLLPKILARLPSAGDEADYRNSVRTRLFAPLEEVQFEALVSVLRSLRSVRTAEAISVKQMCAVLTDALPALDPDRLTVIAESMERIADLENQLQRAKTETSLLETADKAYQRYLATVAQREAAGLLAADGLFGDLAKKERDATGTMRAARDRQSALKDQRAGALAAISELEGRRDAADAAMRDHAGAELPYMERGAEEAAREAGEAATRAGDARSAADALAERASSSADSAAQGREHLAGLGGQLRAHAVSLAADAAVEGLLAVTDQLTAPIPALTAVPGTTRLCAVPLAWAEARQAQVRVLRGALRGHEQAQQAEKAAARDRRDTEDEEDSSRSKAEAAAGKREEAERALREALGAWSAGSRQLGPVPPELTTPGEDDDSGDRLDPDRLTAWLQAAAGAARDRIGLSRHEKAAATDAALAAAAAEASTQAHGLQEEADERSAQATDGYNLAVEQAQAEASRDGQRRSAALASRDRAVESANAQVSAAEQDLGEGTAQARDAVREWTGQARAWQAGASYLSGAHLYLLSPDAGAAELDGLDPAVSRAAVAGAHDAVVPGLERAVAQAQHEVEQARHNADQAEAALENARRVAPVPAGPPWRTRNPADGIPLWALVDFAGHLTAAEADRLEGALLVSGLLDALVTPGGLAVAGDLSLTPAGTASGRSLADLLETEPGTGVDPDRLRGLLRAVPVDTPGGVPGGTLVNGVLTAASPAGYRSKFIGRTTRERARLARVAALEGELAAAADRLRAASDVLRAREGDVLAARAERDAFPAGEGIESARALADELRLGLAAARHRASDLIGDADLTLQRTLADLDRAADARSAALAAARKSMDQAAEAAADATRNAQTASAAAAGKAETARRSEQARQDAETAQKQADGEHASFPAQQAQRVLAAHQAEDEAIAELERARAAVVKAAERHRLAGQEVRDALRDLNSAAALPGGGLLPTSQAGLDDHADAVTQLGHQVELWDHAAKRTIELLRDAARDEAAAAHGDAAAIAAGEEAQAKQLKATRQAAALTEARRLYGAEYEKLAADRKKIGDELAEANDQAAQLLTDLISAGEDAATASAALDTIAPQRQSAGLQRDKCLRDLGRLIDEGLAAMPEDVPAGASGHPAGLTAGLTWARRLLAGQPGGADRLEALTQARARAMTSLENSARTASTSLARFGRQVAVFTIEGTDWRRAVAADPDSARGEDLHQAVEGLRRAAEQLDSDLREDVKQTMRTGLFTQLQRDIQVHREAAQDLVRQIRDTLAGVRTGVAGVGIDVDWAVRKDSDAQRMVELISQPPSDEVYDQMYAVLRQRMDEVAGEEWKDRVAHTFDYREWHEWTIRVTHASFTGDGPGAGKFKEVTTRSNPLESLSTGERRLATMLPLLAAAWSMYSGDYKGPRLLSIDEIDAAFDEPNLRQVLALLRSWDFDVLATAPSMTPLIKREAGRAVVHQVIPAGKHRMTVPWLWEGHGEPQPLTLELTAPAPAPQPQGQE